MHKETVEALAQIVVRDLVKTNGTDIESLALHEWLGDELPGLQIEDVDLIVDKAEEYLKIVEIHVDIPFWRLDEAGLEKYPMVDVLDC